MSSNGATAQRHASIHPSARVGAWPESMEWLEDIDKPHHGVLLGGDVCIRSHVTVDSGCERPTVVGDRTFLMSKVHIGHDCKVGNDVTIAPNSTVEGYAEIGAGASLGSNVVILAFRKVGAGAKVGSGSVVTRDVPAGATVCGNPAREIEPNPVPYSERRAETVVRGAGW